MALGAGLSGLALGWTEQESKQRFYATAAMLPIAAASFAGCFWLYFALPYLWGILAGLGVLIVGGLVVYLLVSRIIPRKVELTSRMR
jgi:hypothetical protein